MTDTDPCVGQRGTGEELSVDHRRVPERAAGRGRTRVESGPGRVPRQGTGAGRGRGETQDRARLRRSARDEYAHRGPGSVRPRRRPLVRTVRLAYGRQEPGGRLRQPLRVRRLLGGSRDLEGTHRAVTPAPAGRRPRRPTAPRSPRTPGG